MAKVHQPVNTMNRQNVSFKELMTWSETNPNRSKSLTPIEISSHNELMQKVEKENTLENIHLAEFESITLTPSGILGAIAFMTDTVYQYSTVKSRQTVLRELATELQVATDNLSGTALGRKRRKIHDGIGSLANTNTVKPEDWLDLFSSLCIMKNIQVIFIQMSKVEVTEKEMSIAKNEVIDESESEAESQKTIYFSQNPCLWTKEHKTWIVDYYGRWIATPKSEESMNTIIEWLEDIEIYGWKVSWPDYSSFTKEDIVKVLSTLPTWKPEHSKLKKDILLARYSKYNTVNALHKLFN